MRRPKVVAAPGHYWEAPWREGLYEDPEILPEDHPRLAAQRLVFAVDPDTNLRRGTFYQRPLGETYIDPFTWYHVRKSVYAAEDRLFWFSSQVRYLCHNKVERFLSLYATPEGRAKLICAGLRLHDDDGNLVNARGDLATEGAKRPGQSDYEYWLGDKQRQPEPFKVETHHNPPEEEAHATYSPRSQAEGAQRKA